MSIRLRRAPLFICFDGQSLNDNPISPGTGYSYKLAEYYGLGVPDIEERGNAWIGGMAWSQLGGSQSQRVFRYANTAEVNLYHMMGGTTDIAVSASGSSTYTRTVAQAQAARTAGFDLVVVVTLSASTGFDGAKETQRLDYNSRLLNHASTDPGVFDACIDICPTPGVGFNDATSNYFTDGTHWTNSNGRPAALAIAEPIIDALL